MTERGCFLPVCCSQRLNAGDVSIDSCPSGIVAGKRFSGSFIANRGRLCNIVIAPVGSVGTREVRKVRMCLSLRINRARFSKAGSIR